MPSTEPATHHAGASSPSPAVAAWLVAGLPEAQEPFTLERIEGGYSMVTYRVADAAGHAWVLRQPPVGQHGSKTRNPLREARVMTALRATAVPVPTVRMTGTTEDPLGLPCHVTDFVEGLVLADAPTAEGLPPAALRTATAGIVSALAAMHAVDPDAVGLGDLGPRRGYVSRQLHRWRSVALECSTPEVADLTAALERMGADLQRRVPADDRGRLVHGDYRLGNAITSADGTIRAILDWELVTLGEPLADLGMLLAFWDCPPEAMLGVRVPTSAPGALSTDEVIDRYVAESAVDVADIAFHRAMGCWRIACTAIRTLSLYRSGSMGETWRAAPFEEACRTWIDLADAELARR